MRLVVLILIAANLAYFAWQYQYAEPVAVMQSAPAKSVQFGNPMVLYSEFQAQTAQVEKSPQLAKAVTEPKEKSGQQARVEKPVLSPRPEAQSCITIGPFSLVSDVSQAAGYFIDQDVSAQQRAAAAKRRAGFWVYIPPQKSLQEAREVLHYLQANDIDDALIIAEGSKENSISVGVYANENKAERRKKVIDAIGYTVNIEPLYRTQPQYWLDLELWTADELPIQQWNKINNRFPSVSQEKHNCKE